MRTSRAVGCIAAQDGEAAQQHVERLDRVEARDRAHDQRVRLETEGFPCRRPRRRGEGDAADIDAVDDDVGATPRRQAEHGGIARLALRNVDDGLRHAGEPALERQVEAVQSRGIALIVNPVKGVDGRHSGPPRREAAVKPRPLAVGVDEIDFARADEAEHGRQRPDAQLVRRDLDERRASLAENPRVRPVGGTRDGDGELGGRQMPDQLAHLGRAPTQAGRDDELENTERLGHLSGSEGGGASGARSPGKSARAADGERRARTRRVCPLRTAAI
jgi:hypothetical protein